MGSHRSNVYRSLDSEGSGERTLANCLFKAVQVVVHMGSAAAEAALRVRNQAVRGTLRALNDDAQQLIGRCASAAPHTGADYRCVTLRSANQSTSRTADHHRPGRSPPSLHRRRARPT
ncbi:hypothetical protein GCM10010403_46200 [Glycomyces rutgersensis]|uniref:Uncharacterized protein n=1 Tax=Glycomyces rutgersensis TaxID=58115 RepID=A0ABN3GA05_9ACTN